MNDKAISPVMEPARPEQALQALAHRLGSGDQAAEASFLTLFEQLANRLLLADPAALLALVESVRDVPLFTSRARQYRRFFQGLALYKTDRYDEALSILDELLAEPDLADEVRGRALNTRANGCRYSGRLVEALTSYRASLTLWQRLGNRQREGLTRLNLGIVAYQLQEFEEAEKSLTLAAGCFAESDARQWLAGARNELGLVYRDQGRWNEALACFEEAAAHYRAEDAEDSLGRVLINVAELYLFQAHLPEAMATCQQALSTLRNRAYAVDVYLALGLVHQVEGDLPGAQAAFEEGLRLALTIGRRDILAEAHYRLGELLRRLGQADAALAHLEAAAAVVETTRQPIGDEDLRISLLGRWQQIYETLVLHCLALGRRQDAFAWSERARARAFAEKVQGLRFKLEGSQEAEPASNLPVATCHLPPATCHLRPNEILLSYFTTGVLDRYVPMLRALAADNPLRDHLLTPARTLLFTITHNDLAAQECPLDPNVLVSVSPRGEDRSRFLGPAVLRRLYDALLAPAVVGQVSNLPSGGMTYGTGRVTDVTYVAPHGPLHRVPFAALLDGDGRPFVRVENPTLVYTPSATLLGTAADHRWPTDKAQRLPCLAIGYDGLLDETPSVVALRHTEAEASLVASLLGGEAWVGPALKRERLTVAAGRYRWLHFACHGRFNEQSPLDSYLVTAAGEKVTAGEVLQEWQLQADLVVLSACQTGVSRILRGDEPMGLVRAFLYAGAKAVLVSQWPVEDLPTFLLMQHFYQECSRLTLTTPSHLAMALQAAQVWLREVTAAEIRELWPILAARGQPVGKIDSLAGSPAGSCPYAQPRYWAAFVVITGPAANGSAA